jgi:hypothetical protein
LAKCHCRVYDKRVHTPHDSGFGLIDDPYSRIVISPPAVHVRPSAVHLPVERPLVLSSKSALPRLLPFLLVGISTYVRYELAFIRAVEFLSNKDHLGATAFAVIQKDC